VWGGGGGGHKERKKICYVKHIDNTRGLSVSSTATTAGPGFDLDNFSIE
jgi:hypothetical protein